ncbi:hypothetical protein EAG_09741 [Camponotus floridanus]|uniref:Uncharacterized protein n=1 Tax=Camponotus floridanus TaxID=104421 RepID=E1ZVP8_CAMFO|nr:hypothetical protein EAG_09741 [Camponotus floridanus]
MAYVPNSHNPKLLLSPVINEPFTSTTASSASFPARCVTVLTVYQWSIDQSIYSITIGDIGAPSCPSQGVDSRKQDGGSRHERYNPSDQK